MTNILDDQMKKAQIMKLLRYEIVKIIYFMPESEILILQDNFRNK